MIRPIAPLIVITIFDHYSADNSLNVIHIVRKTRTIKQAFY